MTIKLLRTHAHRLKAIAHAALFLFITASFSIALAQDADKTTTTTTTATQTDEAEQQEAKPEPTPDTPAKSVIRGRVIYEDTNRPLRRARIALLKTDGSGGGGMEKTGATDERGEFIINDVAAGSYIVVVDVPGVITPFSSVELDDGINERSAMIALRKEYEEVTVNGTNTVDVRVRARRGGVISGRVQYEDGEPVINAQILIMRKKDNRPMRFITGFSAYNMMSLKTDDRGVYRIAGLPSGEYLLGASEPNTRDDQRDEYAAVFGGANFSVSYYQNETSLKQARPVKVEAGREAGDINITILNRPLYTISGTVVARQGRTPVRARINIQGKNEAGTIPFLDVGPNTSTDEQGRWSFSEIPDGTYVIKVDPVQDSSDEDEEYQAMMRSEGQAGAATTRQTSTAPRRPALVTRRMEVNVSGADLTGVVIEVSEGGRIQGTISFDGGDKELQPGVNFLFTPRDGSEPVSSYAVVRQGGLFNVDKIPPGEFYVHVNPPGEKLYVKSVTAGGVDLMREPVRIAPGTSIDNVRIVISADMATLQGRVVSASDSKPVRGAFLVLVPSEPARWRSTGSFVPGVTQADGTFKITAAPGSYLLILLSEKENLNAVNESFIRARSAGAKTVTLSANGRESVELVAPAGSP